MMLRAGGLLCLLIVSACASTGSPERASLDVVTRAEMDGVHAADAYALLQRLRPQFLRSRGAVSMRNSSDSYPIVYLNNVRHGGVMSLRDIVADDIQEIRFISAADATTRWGTGHGSGVILVLTM
jgi:hypothetical protein